MIYQRQVIAYHGCLRERYENALLRGVHPPMSEEAHDWLGRGVYFWEHGPQRALEWAQAKAIREDRDPSEACVLGAIVQLGECFDLLDTRFTTLLGYAHAGLVAASEEPLPQNRAQSAEGDVLLRFLDRAVIEFAVEKLTSELGPRAVQTVRGAFWEGGEAFPGAEIQRKSHIQLAVRDTSCIVGYFRPDVSCSF